MARKKKIGFARLNRRRRKAKIFWVKKLIAQAKEENGGMFFAYDELYGKNDSVDCYFLSKDGKTPYFCYLYTTRDVYRSRVEDAAVEQVPHAFPGGENPYSLAMPKCRAIADARTIQVFEKVTLDYRCRDGIFLEATIDVPYLTVETINDFIRRFLVSEKAYTGTVPVTFNYQECEFWWEEKQFTIAEVNKGGTNGDVA